MKKAVRVPYTVVAIDPEIQRMREMLTSGEDLEIDTDGTISKAGTAAKKQDGKKAKTVPKAIVSAERSSSVQDILNEMRGDYTPHEEDLHVEGDPKPKKTSIVPKGIVSKSVSELLEEMRGEAVEYDTTEDLSELLVEESDENVGKAKLVPKGVLSARAWYQTNPDLLRAEKAAMYDYQGNKAEFGYLSDGRAYWRVRCQPKIAGKEKSRCRKYDIALIYDNDHPKARYGSSVKAYLLKPTIDDLQKIVNNCATVTPKTIPHLLRDDKGELYLCSSDTSNVSADLNSAKGVTSAATSLRFALRWINIFELGLVDPETWELFQGHGKI